MATNNADTAEADEDKSLSQADIAAYKQALGKYYDNDGIVACLRNLKTPKCKSMRENARCFA